MVRGSTRIRNNQRGEITDRRYPEGVRQEEDEHGEESSESRNQFEQHQGLVGLEARDDMG